MPRRPTIPAQLRNQPFRGSTAIRDGLVTRAMLRSPVWQRLLHDVYIHRDSPVDHQTWCRAVALILPAGAAIGGLSAAHLWGFETRAARVSVVLPHNRWIRADDHLLPHRTSLVAGDLTCHDGLPVTTPVRTAFDLGRRLGRADALALLDAMLRRRLLRRPALQQMIKQRFTWPGTARLAGLVRVADSRAESPMESRLRLLLLDARLPSAVPQFEIRDPAGRLLGRVDLCWPDLGLIAEYDGDHHRSKVQFRRDVARLNALRMAGWTVLRFTADDVLRNPRHLIATVSAALAEAADRR
jgi:very-short-patch-repair endonuclease